MSTQTLPRPKARPGTAGAKRAAAKRQILDAARDVISERGFNGAQMSAIAERAGVATGSLYRHFQSKEDLSRAVFKEVARREVNLTRQIATGEGSVSDRARSVFRTIAERVVAGRSLAAAMIAEPVEGGLNDERRLFRQAQAKILTELIEEGVASGEFRPCHPKITAACIAAGITAALVGPLAVEEYEFGESSKTMIDAILEVNLRPILQS